MQELFINHPVLILSLGLNLSLLTLGLLKYYPTLIKYYKEEKIKRDRQKRYYIRKVVRDYLEELKK